MQAIRRIYRESPGWEKDILEKIEHISNKTGIEAWASTGLFYRPFFNARFGVTQSSFDKDICVRRNSCKVCRFCAYWWV